MQIALLGPLEVRADTGEPMEVGGARLRTLLTLLALDAGRLVSTQRLVAGIWGDRAPAGAANALQALVSRLRRGLPAGVIESHPTGYRLAVEPAAVDVHRFERLVSAGRAALASDPRRAATVLAEALALWRGPALAGLPDSSLPPAAAVRLIELRLAALEDHADAGLRLGNGRRLVADLEAVVAAYPTRERAVGLLMRALSAAGRGADALAAFERTRSVLAERLGADPSPDLTSLHVRALRGELVTPAPVEATDEPVRTNLRAALTSFVGRDEEVTRVGKLVGGSRLTTLTGPGGSGKTRLAVESARTLLGQLPDGVWLVELAPVTEATEVASTILAALGLRPRATLGGPRGRPPAGAAWSTQLDLLEQHLDAGDDPVDRLVGALVARELLLVLDNCEHLVGAVAGLVERLLGDCPRLRVLATSREPLGITGETLWPVEPLALPPAGTGPAEAMSYAAVRLLADRAAAVRPGFAIDARSVAAIARICRALDGMPLAIELAAARLRAMPPDQLASRLDDRFRLLTGGSRTALPRHQTLRAVVDWSWDLLSEAERAVWRRLAVFAGGATLEAAERVCASPDLPADQVLDLLTALADKSLLTPIGDGVPRYRMLETIRAYGWERLAEVGEVDRVRRAHVAYFVGLAEAAEPHLRTADQLEWIARLDSDVDNLAAAMRAATSLGDAAGALRLLGALGWYWSLTGHRAEGVELARAALAVPGDAPTEVRALAYTMAAINAVDGGHDEATADAWFRKAAELAAGSDHGQHPMLRLIVPLYQVFEAWIWGRDQPPPQPALDRLAADPDPWVRATALAMRAHVRLNLGHQPPTARADFEAALAAYRAAGDRWGVAFMLTSLGELAAWRGDIASAAVHTEEAVALHTELGDSSDAVQARVQLAQLRWSLGDRPGADTALASAQRRAAALGLPDCLVGVVHTAGELARLDGDLDTARARLHEAQDRLSGAGSFPQFRARVLTSLGATEVASGDPAAGRAYHLRALDLAMTAGDAVVIARVLVGLAGLALAEHDPHRAAVLLGASVAVRGVEDRSLPDALRVAAAARAALGEPTFAEAYAHGRATTTGAPDVRRLAGITTPGA